MIIEKKFIDLFAKTTQRGAYGASTFKGKNNKNAADKAAVDEMRKELNCIDMKGKIVIGEGEMDEAPMLFINEEVGNNTGDEFDIAVDPLEGTNFTAQNLPNSLSVLAVGRKNCLLKAPDMYMEKIAIGANLPKDLVKLDFSVKKNLELLCDAKKIKPSDLKACVLKRTRHKNIIKALDDIGAKINFITDGDVSGAISVADKTNGNDIFLGIGGAPEGVLAAAALKCLGCQMQSRLIFQNENEKEKARNLGITDLNKIYTIHEMVKDDVIFCATGVTDGDLVRGITYQDKYFNSETFVLHLSSSTNKIIKNKSEK